MSTKSALVLIGFAALVAPRLALAVVTFDQLDDDVFVVSHMVKGLAGNRGKAMRLVHEKAASLCVAAGYTHLKIDGEASRGTGHRNNANASVRVRFFFADGVERTNCKKNADARYVAQAAAKLSKKGYQQPDPAASASEEVTSQVGSCTVEQISTMAKAGLSADQIKAACR